MFRRILFYINKHSFMKKKNICFS